MSYNVYLDIDTGSDEPATVAEIGNYTSNVAWMWREALGQPLYELHGRNAADSVPQLDAALDALRERADHFRSGEPENGWGDYDGAVGYLQRLRDLCAMHPKTCIYVSH